MLSLKIRGYIKMHQQPMTTHTSYVGKKWVVYHGISQMSLTFSLNVYTQFISRLYTYVKEMHVHVTYGLFQVIIIIIMIIIIIIITIIS